LFFSAYHTVTLLGPKGDPVPAFFEWGQSLNALAVVSAWIDEDGVLPVVRTLVVFPIYSDTYFPLRFAHFDRDYSWSIPSNALNFVRSLRLRMTFSLPLSYFVFKFSRTLLVSL
jgi:hypothetical protein